ncbi:hypothetical protein SAMN02799630_04678 [Paenibacillus sp. UNCCL117]|uniref:AlkZ-related protein n=1 Tax=unclassified Paenibacillus TaxID=185978 RepID=UPI0008835C8C|nr:MULTISPECIES: hypothetical protein [unclassified Paenibacillus]SDE06605.1 hypothetical protein SAMN04488602_11817 [Paenibacillus sp. cl123]SFW59367.1 hypothetical protein SAMN02799630_04678 [Paenibacillus sp. UNCCL117]
MGVSNYDEFIQLVEKFKIFPFSDFVPEYPSLTAVTANNHWHTGNETDPWLWRIRIVQDGIAAYGKFFGSKACFIHTQLFPVVRSILTSGKTVDERYKDGLISSTAYHIYKVLKEHGNMDSRNLRKLSGLDAKEAKKEYEKSLVELQNYGDVVITGTAKQNDNDSGWSSMCYEPSELWIKSNKGPKDNVSLNDAKMLLAAELSRICTDKSYKYFAKKLHLETNHSSGRDEKSVL